MSHPVHFFQPCPVCGRSLRIRVNLLGRRVFCEHCGGAFTARDASLAAADPVAPVPLADRVEDLLARASLVLARAGVAGEGD